MHSQSREMFVSLYGERSIDGSILYRIHDIAQTYTWYKLQLIDLRLSTHSRQRPSKPAPITSRLA